MRKLIIDGTSVFEIDEECAKRKNVPKNCEIKKYLNETKNKNNISANKINSIQKTE